MKNFLPLASMISAYLFLAGCVSAPNNAPDTGQAPTGNTQIYQFAVVDAPPITIEKAADIPGVLQRLQRMHATVNRQIRASDVELFAASDIGESYLSAKRSKALSVGIPREQCPHYEAVYGAENLDAAVEGSFQGCMDYLNQTGRDGEACGCQLVVVNDVLLVKPEDLPYRDRLQAHLVWRQGRRGPLSRLVGVGDIPDGKSATPLVITSVRGTELCSGDLTETTPGKGAATLRCPGIGDNLVGNYEIEGLRQGREYGVALAASGETVAALFFGYSENQYQEARDRVLKELLAR